MKLGPGTCTTYLLLLNQLLVCESMPSGSRFFTIHRSASKSKSHGHLVGAGAFGNRYSATFGTAFTTLLLLD